MEIQKKSFISCLSQSATNTSFSKISDEKDIIYEALNFVYICCISNISWLIHMWMHFFLTGADKSFSRTFSYTDDKKSSLSPVKGTEEWKLNEDSLW